MTPKPVKSETVIGKHATEPTTPVTCGSNETVTDPWVAADKLALVVIEFNAFSCPFVEPVEELRPTLDVFAAGSSAETLPAADTARKLSTEASPAKTTTQHSVSRKRFLNRFLE
jgi:hypothetical protein